MKSLPGNLFNEFSRFLNNALLLVKRRDGDQSVTSISGSESGHLNAIGAFICIIQKHRRHQCKLGIFQINQTEEIQWEDLRSGCSIFVGNHNLIEVGTQLAV